MVLSEVSHTSCAVQHSDREQVIIVILKDVRNWCCLNSVHNDNGTVFCVVNSYDEISGISKVIR